MSDNELSRYNGTAIGSHEAQKDSGMKASATMRDEKRRSWLLRLVFPDSVSRHQMKITLILFFAMFGNSLTLTMVFAYLPRLTRDFGIDDIHIGTYAGIVASSLFVGRTVASYFWGRIVDRFGRRSTILISNLLLSIFTLLFGFNWSFWWVTFARFMQGAVNGLVVSAKVAVSDITDETNQSAVMGVVLSSFSFGLIIGPTIGGFLALPHEQYPNIFSKDSVFGKYPYLLPNLIAFSLIVASLFFTYFYMPETLKRDKKSEKDPLLEQPNHVRSTENNGKVNAEALPGKCRTCNNLLSSYEYSQLSDIYVVCSFKSGSKYMKTYGVKAPLIEHQSKLATEPDEKPQMLKMSCSHFEEEVKPGLSYLRCCNSCCRRKKPSLFLQLIKIKDVRNIVLLYGFFSFVSIAYDELLPVFAATPRKYHGLGFSTADIGTVLFAQTVPNIVSMIFVAPKLEVRFGGRKLYIFAAYLFAFAMPLIPCCVKLTSKASLWSVLILVLITIRIASALGFLAINIILNNSVKPDLLGAANGLGMAVSALFRALSPAAVGSLYSWSLQNDHLGFPLNYNFVFLLLSFISVITLGLLVFIPKSFDKKKDQLMKCREEYSSDS